MSKNAAKSCAGCHDPALAFTDGYRKPPGIFGDLSKRNTPSLLNLSYQTYFNRANPEITSVFAQLDGPLFGQNPVEMGLRENDTTVLALLANDGVYHDLFRQAFSNERDPVSWPNVKVALSSYVMSLSSFRSPYDAYLAGDSGAISLSAKKGEELFFSTKYNCASCHKPPLFGADTSMPTDDQFANIGLYNYRDGNYPFTDQGLFSVTGLERDKGRFKIPSLRNLDLTGPYFHDGSTENLGDVLEIYADGGRVVNFGRWQGDGRLNPYKHRLIKKIDMSSREKYELLDFLLSLNDTTLKSNPDFRSPFGPFDHDL